jgi:hypothetical protein
MMSLLLFSGLLLAAQPRMPEFSPSDQGAVLLEEEQLGRLIRDYAKEASAVFIGELVSASTHPQDPTRGTQAIFSVEEQIRGRVPSVIDVLIPPVGDYMPGDPYPAPITAIPGYKMVVFVNPDGEAIAHNSLFLYQGGYAWRAKRDDIFFNPVRDRHWTSSIDPSEDYVLIAIDDLREQVRSHPRRMRAQLTRSADR